MARSFERRVWFRAKRYGWGWYPATWEGWVTTLLAIGLFLIPYLRALRSGTAGDEAAVLWWSIISTLPFIALVIVCYRTGEKPGWRWG